MQLAKFIVNEQHDKLVEMNAFEWIIEKLGELLLQEALNLRGVRPQVEQLQAQLNRMERFLEAADARPKGGEDEIIICNCVAEIREASNDAETAIAAFVVKIAFPLREVRLEIERINTRITNSLTTGVQTSVILHPTEVGESSSSTSTAERQLRRSYTYIVEEDVVGVEENVKAIVDLLVKEKTHYRVVSIWGMGGLAKSTLAKTIYMCCLGLYISTMQYKGSS
ncbi:putative disease resistance protein RXW24L [Camellia lanceoleosa]|nr:putative disease resistance protein RXW24L [Camellia lanceoleosa]